MSALKKWRILVAAIVVMPAGLTGAFGTEAWDGLDHIHAHISSLKVAPGRGLIGAAATEVGHWHFVNRSGERFTAADREEIKRGLGLLAPEAAGEPRRLAIYIDTRTLFEHAGQLSALPPMSSMSVISDGRAFPVFAFGNGSLPRKAVEILPNILVETESKAAFDEVRWQLSRPLDRARVRTLALTPGGATAITRTPTIDRPSRLAKPNSIDPAHLADGLSRLTGQYVLVSGRLSGEQLLFNPENGPRSSVSIAILEAKARRHDVNLMIVSASSPRQPGTRSWLWMKSGLSTVDAAVSHRQLGPFLVALAGDVELLVRPEAINARRVGLEVIPMADALKAGQESPLGGWTGAMSEKLSDLVSDTSGRISVEALRLRLPSRVRQREIDRRILPWLRSDLQIVIGLILLSGVVTLPVQLSWWRSLWPAEIRQEYAGFGGYALAVLARWLGFAIFFLPLAALPAIPLAVWRLFSGGAKQRRPKDPQRAISPD